MTRAVAYWFGTTDDQKIPDRVRVRVFDQFKGRCAKCTRKLQPGQWALDHIVALANGGLHCESNLRPLCVSPCHSQKTRQDVAEKSRTYRKRKSMLGIRKPRTITRWRKFNGDVVQASRSRA